MREETWNGLGTKQGPGILLDTLSSWTRPRRRELIQVENSAHGPTQAKQRWPVKLAVFGGASLGKNKGVARRTEARPQCNTHYGTPGPAPPGASYPLRVETDLKPSLKAPTGNPLGSLAPMAHSVPVHGLVSVLQGPLPSAGSDL